MYGEFLGLLRIVVWVAGPVVGYLIAKNRGVDPVLGAVVGLLSCVGWGLIFLLPSNKKLLGGP